MESDTKRITLQFYTQKTISGCAVIGLGKHAIRCENTSVPWMSLTILLLVQIFFLPCYDKNGEADFRG
jgi:hypothetical protein